MKTAALLIGSLVVASCGGNDDQSATVAPVSSPAPTSTSTTVPPATTLTESTTPSTTASTVPPGDSSTTTSSSVAAASSTAPATTPASTAAVAHGDPTVGTAVVYVTSGGEFPWLPVGWWDGGSWGSVEWPDADDAVPTASFSAVSVSSIELADSPQRDRTDYRAQDYECVDSPGPPSIVLDARLPESDAWYGYRALAVTADWDVQPRPVRAVGLDVPEYQQLGESLVPASDETDPTRGDVVQVVRADLDGDGIEEVLFAFEYFADPGFGAPGDFSLVVARYPKADGTVVDDVVFEHVVPSPVDFPSPDRGRVIAVADVNGDAVMEVAIGIVHWEGASAGVYEFRDGELHPVMGAGCGV
jgi:hypothetical protein